MLDLMDLVAPDKLNPGRIAQCISTLTTFADIAGMVGTIVVNLDLCTVNEDKVTELRLGHRESEVVTLCLIAYWMQPVDDSDHKLSDICCDLVLDGRCLGVGSRFNSERLKFIDKDESDRESIGASSFRMMHFLVKCAGQLQRENRLEDKKDMGERLSTSFKEDNVKTAASKYSPDTCKRYLSLGAKFDTPEIVG